MISPIFWNFRLFFEFEKTSEKSLAIRKKRRREKLPQKD